jgi:hypothetical protein
VGRRPAGDATGKDEGGARRPAGDDRHLTPDGPWRPGGGATAADGRRRHSFDLRGASENKEEEEETPRVKENEEEKALGSSGVPNCRDREKFALLSLLGCLLLGQKLKTCS